MVIVNQCFIVRLWLFKSMNLCDGQLLLNDVDYFLDHCISYHYKRGHIGCHIVICLLLLCMIVNPMLHCVILVNLSINICDGQLQLNNFDNFLERCEHTI